ncbi:TPA: outer membrane protein assembly factor BamB [Legionella pneumophila]|uniref:outer membrane protein assembly factor BamB n=1 Tax=Legionella pneumophila TaxID=446 RepID=UPI00078711B0|nr:outer membrane protein assembly factor BamB [Legionella pneumophila]MDW8879042.1 outer membrane protein assembly factor BamB [Legionella pneumophila subsp. fraseri]MDW8961521.1 outer membrane protein assembly factor BamB [Legionella pneumophila subsp. fraseri]MDW9036202.1 outer membrane protein assembly factor BamB [Legionella pneumophila subsp. fraseri]MDW9039041.1 outer membrane protein assembly factor BamB [Legionella pneumophila subsp. fraseri]MDW9041889.1 outer membrane protein assembl
MKIRILVLILCALTQGCTYVDDYMLGKDNTPQPKELKEIQPKVKMAQNWTAPVGKTHKTNEYLNIKPAIRGDIIYTADASGLVQAVSKKDGQIKWSTSLKNNIVSGPTVAGGYLVVGTNASTLVLLNQSDGKEIWQNKVSAEVLAPPALSHQKVIAKTIDGKVYAIDAVNGKQLWVADHGAPSLVLKASSSPIIVDNLVLVGFSDGKLDAFELQTGRLIWQRSIAYGMGASDVERLVDIDSDPIISNNVAYLATYQGYVGALSLSNGQFIWRKPASVYKNMLLSHNNLYFTDSNDVLWSLNSNTGQVNWKQTSLKARGLTAPALVGGNLVVGDKTGYLHILSTQTGELLGRSQLSGGVTVSPSVSGKNMYVLTNNGTLNQLTVS